MMTQNKVSHQLFYFFMITCISLLLYWPGLNGHFFILDDQFTIPNLGPLNHWQDILTSLQGNDTGLLRRPVAIFILSILKTFSEDASIYKWCNWLIHSFNSILVYYLLTQLFNALNIKNKLPLLIITVIWSCHPLLVSTILYPVQIMTTLASFFMLASLNIYLYMHSNNRYSLTLYLALTLTSISGLLSKEIAALLPIHFLLLEWLILKYDSSKKFNKASRRLVQLFIILPLVIGSITFVFILPELLNGYKLRDFSLFDRLMIEPVIIVHYIQQILIPNNQALTLFQDFWNIELISSFEIFFNLSIIIALFFIGYQYRNKIPLLSYGIFFFFISHLLESTLLPLELAFEHRNYLASMGLISSLVYLFFISKSWYQLSIITLCLYTLILLTITYNRTMNWRNESTFYTSAYNKNQPSPRAIEAYAQILIHKGKSAEGLTLIKQLKEKTNNGSYDIRLASLSCNIGNNINNTPESLLDTRLVANNKYDKGLSQVLFNLFEKVMLRKCPISYTHLINYHQKLLIHPDISHQKNNIYVIQFLLARYYWLDKQVGNSIKYYVSAYKQDKMIPAGLELLSIYAATNDKNNARQLIKELKVNTSRMTASERINFNNIIKQL